MYKNKAQDGTNNICGKRIKAFREALPSRPSQQGLSVLLQVAGLDLDKNAVQRMESGKRFISDVELKALATVLKVSYADLLDP